MAISNEKIFDAALRVWNDRGFSRTTLKRIGELAGVGDSALVRRFESKEELMRLAFEHAADQFCCDCIASGDLRADLIRLVDALREPMRSKGRLVVDFLLEVSRTEEVIAMAPAARAAINRAATVIAEYQAAGLLKGTNPWEPMLALVGPLLLPAFQHDPQKKIYPSAAGNVDEFLRGWQSKPDIDNG